MAEPIGSIPFTNPEKINTNPSKILAIILKYFIVIEIIIHNLIMLVYENISKTIVNQMLTG